MFDLSNKGQWFFCARCFLGKGGSLGICCESVEVVTALFLIRGTTLRMKPDTVFQNLVPDVASTSFRKWRIGADKTRVYSIRVAEA